MSEAIGRGPSPTPEPAEPPPAGAPPDPAPWGLKGAVVVTALSLGGQIVFSFVVVAFVSVIVGLLEPGIIDHPDELTDIALLAALAPVALLSSVFTLALVYVSITAFSRRPFFASLKLSRPSGSSLAVYLALGFGLALGYILTTTLFPMPPMPEEEGALTKLAQSGLLGHAMWAALAMVIAPIVEEILFRGYAYLGARRALGPSGAGAAVTVVFVLLHTGETGAYWPALAGITALSAILIVVIERTGNLTHCIACHLGYNGALTSLSFLGGG